MATSRICLSSTGYSATELIPFYKRLSFTNSIKLTINELQSKRLRTKNNTQTHMYRHIVEEHHLYCTGFGHLQGLMDTDRQVSPYHLYAWLHATLCPQLQYLCSQRLTRHRPISQEKVMPSYPGPTYTNVDVFCFPVRKNMQKLLIRQVAGVHGKLIFYHVHGRKFMASKPSIKEQYTVTKDNLTEFQSISLAELTLFYTSR